MFFKTKSSPARESKSSIPPPVANGFMSHTKPAPSIAAVAENRSAELSPPAPTAEQVQKWATNEAAFAVTFARVVSVDMRSPHYKRYALADLESRPARNHTEVGHQKLHLQNASLDVKLTTAWKGRYDIFLSRANAIGSTSHITRCSTPCLVDDL